MDREKQVASTRDTAAASTAGAAVSKGVAPQAAARQAAVSAAVRCFNISPLLPLSGAGLRPAACTVVLLTEA